MHGKQFSPERKYGFSCIYFILICVGESLARVQAQGSRFISAAGTRGLQDLSLTPGKECGGNENSGVMLRGTDFP